MALCRDSWVEWSDGEPARFDAFRDGFMSAFSRNEEGRYFVPKAEVSVMGLRVVEAYPASVGMGVGFSLTVDAAFDDARKAVETALGKTLEDCAADEGMRHCELAIAPRRTFMLMAEDKKDSRRTLIGCYYFYEK